MPIARQPYYRPAKEKAEQKKEEPVRFDHNKYNRWVRVINDHIDGPRMPRGQKTKNILHKLSEQGRELGLNDEQVLDSICQTARDWYTIEFVWPEARDHPDHERYGDYCTFKPWLVQHKLTEMAHHAGYAKVVADHIQHRERQKYEEKKRIDRIKACQRTLTRYLQKAVPSRIEAQIIKDTKAEIIALGGTPDLSYCK